MENEENTNPGSSEKAVQASEFIPVQGKNGGTLHTFPPGVSGNKKGRPKGSRSLKSIMNKLLDEQVIIEYEPGKTMAITRREALMLNKLDLALNSQFDAVKLAAIKDIEDRLDGRPVSQLPGNGGEDANDYYVFYIPNAHSRKRQIDYEAED